MPCAVVPQLFTTHAAVTVRTYAVTAQLYVVTSLTAWTYGVNFVCVTPRAATRIHLLFVGLISLHHAAGGCSSRTRTCAHAHLPVALHAFSFFAFCRRTLFCWNSLGVFAGLCSYSQRHTNTSTCAPYTYVCAHLLHTCWSWCVCNTHCLGSTRRTFMSRCHARFTRRRIAY